MPRHTTDKGFSLLEVMIALGVMTIGVLGVAGVISGGMRTLGTTPADVVSSQKAAQAIEAVFSARDSRVLGWAMIRNQSNGGLFKDGWQALNEPGPDGLVHTIDDLAAIESVALPGPDQLLGTPDDKIDRLTGYKRRIVITDVAGTGTPSRLRTITVTISYPAGSTTKEFVLSTLIQSYT